MLRRFFLAAFALLFLAPVASAQQQPQPQPRRVETAIFAGGCFWCMEHDMGAIPGVLDVMSGYTGGTLRHPTYENHEGHFEAVRVQYDANRISYAQLLERYWPLTDPTDNGGQFCDRGPSYRPAVFVTEAQRPVAEASIAALRASHRVNGEIVTPILPATFWTDAEEYHRDYSHRHAAAYTAYRVGCGRDARLRQVWRRPNS